MPALGLPQGYELVVLLAVLLLPVFIVIVAIRLTRGERRDAGSPDEPPDRPPG